LSYQRWIGDGSPGSTAIDNIGALLWPVCDQATIGVA